jgi:hypothetical protein
VNQNVDQGMDAAIACAFNTVGSKPLHMLRLCHSHLVPKLGLGVPFGICMSGLKKVLGKELVLLLPATVHRSLQVRSRR